MMIRRSLFGSTRIWLNEYPAFELMSSAAVFVFRQVLPPSSVR